MATAFATDGEGSTYQFIRFGRVEAGLPGLALEGHLNAVADAGAARVLAAQDADAPASPAETRVEAEGLDVTGEAVEVTLYLDEQPLAGNYANGGPNLHNYLLQNVPAYAAAVANPDFDFVGIGIASSGSNALGNAEVGVSAVFVDTDAVAFIDPRDDSGTFDIWGTNGPDEIVGTDGGEVIRTNDPAASDGTSDTGGNTVLAGAGDDMIYGTGNLANTLNGGAGNDTYWDVKTGDVIVEAADGGIDTIITTTSFSLEGYADVENLSAAGVIVGNDLSNTLRSIFGTEATLDGKGGDDILQGGALNDLFIVDSEGDVVQENPRFSSSYDVVRAYTDYVLPEGQGIEQLELRRVRDADGNVVQDVAISGNEFANRIIGNGQRNALDGGAGDDELIGGRGTDILTGGAGA
ncbi:calcium-binding protein, partial [Wenxinia marina]